MRCDFLGQDKAKEDGSLMGCVLEMSGGRHVLQGSLCCEKRNVKRDWEGRAGDVLELYARHKKHIRWFDC